MTEKENRKSTVDLWFCKVCGVAHMRAGKVQLSFDSSEFQQLTERVIELNYSEWHLPENAPIRIGDSVAVVDDVFSSSRMH